MCAIIIISIAVGGTVNGPIYATVIEYSGFGHGLAHDDACAAAPNHNNNALNNNIKNVNTHS